MEFGSPNPSPEDACDGTILAGDVIASGHPLHNEEACLPFSYWMDAQLRTLESRFDHFQTASSMKTAFGR